MVTPQVVAQKDTKRQSATVLSDRHTGRLTQTLTDSQRGRQVGVGRQTDRQKDTETDETHKKGLISISDYKTEVR